MEAIRLYSEADALETNDIQCKLDCQRELLKAYHLMGKNAGLKQLQLYFFDCELESAGHVLYLAGASSAEGQAIIESGPRPNP